MKALVCEMCQGSEFVKQDGFFVCQYCGVKYTPEEAKRMIIEGTVSVEGTVKVDNSDFIQKSLANARRAMQKEDWEEVERYYNMVEQHDPKNIEAIFYSAYGKAKTALISSDIYRRQAAFKVLQNSVSIIDDNFNVEKEVEQLNIVRKISADIISMANSSYVYNTTRNGYGNVISSDKNQTERLFHLLCFAFMESVMNIASMYPEGQKETRKTYYKMAVIHGEYILKHNCQIDRKAVTARLNWLYAIVAPEKIITPKVADLSVASKISFWLGIVSLALSFIPFVNVCVSCASLCGIITGIVGLMNKNKKTATIENRKKAIIGMILSGGAIVATILMYVCFFAVLLANNSL